MDPTTIAMYVFAALAAVFGGSVLVRRKNSDDKYKKELQDAAKRLEAQGSIHVAEFAKMKARGASRLRCNQKFDEIVDIVMNDDLFATECDRLQQFHLNLAIEDPGKLVTIKEAIEEHDAAAKRKARKELGIKEPVEPEAATTS